MIQLINYQLTNDRFRTLVQTSIMSSVHSRMAYDTRCYFNVRSKADISQHNLLHMKPVADADFHKQPTACDFKAGHFTAYTLLLPYFLLLQGC